MLFLSTHSRSSVQPKNDAKPLFFILPYLSPVILANATVVVFVLLRSSSFRFHCYTQRKATPTEKSARKWQVQPFATSCAKDYEGHSLLQTSCAELPNSHRLVPATSCPPPGQPVHRLCTAVTSPGQPVHRLCTAATSPGSFYVPVPSTLKLSNFAL